jgi:hypothetical protein
MIIATHKMTKTIILSICFCIILYNGANSQKISAGLILGGNMNQEILHDIPTMYAINGLNRGIHAGFFFQDKFSNNLGISTELEWIRKGVQYTITGNQGKDTTVFNMQKWNLDYIEIKPLLFWQFGNYLKFGIGPYFGLLFDENYSGKTIMSLENGSILTNSIQKIKVNLPKTVIDYGFNISLSHSFSERVEIMFSLERGLNLRDLFNPNPTYTPGHRSYNNSYLLSLNWTLKQSRKTND